MNYLLRWACIFGLLMCYQGIALSAQNCDLGLVVRNTNNTQTAYFEDYESVIAFLEAHVSESQLLDEFGKNTALKILNQSDKGFSIDLEPLRDYQSSVTETVWSGLSTELRNQVDDLGCGVLQSEKCKWLKYLTSHALWELFLTQAKQVYYQKSNSDKAAAHKRAVTTFSLLQKRLTDSSASEYDLNHLSSKVYLLAHELTNDVYYKTTFMQKVNTFLSIHFYGEEQFTQNKTAILARYKAEVIERSTDLRLSLPEKYRARHELNFYLDTAITQHFVADYAHLIEDEKGRLLGDEWKLYNNAVPFFEKGLDRALLLLGQGKTLEDIGWSKLRLINRSLKIKVYAAESGFKFAWGKYQLKGEYFFEQISKQGGWSTLAPFLASETISLYRNKSVNAQITVDGKRRGKALDHIARYL